jgi:thiosulfate/3-mercaptopyruvate sulfurtransferase
MYVGGGRVPARRRSTTVQERLSGTQRGDTLVTYCLVGLRASGTYLAARLLGLPVFMYDGSYDDWGARKLPLTKGATP